MIFDPDELKDEEPAKELTQEEPAKELTLENLRKFREQVLKEPGVISLTEPSLTEPIDFRSLLNSLKALTNSLPPSRERSLALTKLDEAGFWLGIARERITF